MYNYYVTIIFLPWILHTHELCQNFFKSNFLFLKQIILIK
jgi:hypothetical protein